MYKYIFGKDSYNIVKKYFAKLFDTLKAMYLSVAKLVFWKMSALFAKVLHFVQCVQIFLSSKISVLEILSALQNLRKFCG